MNQSNRSRWIASIAVIVVGVFAGSLMAWQTFTDGSQGAPGAPSVAVSSIDRSGGSNGERIHQGREHATQDSQGALPEPAQRGCRFQVGDKMAYEVEMTAVTRFDLGSLAGGTALKPPSAAPSGTPLEVQATWLVELHAIQVDANGSTVLAARIRKGQQRVAGGQATETSGDLEPTFLVRMEPTCALREFARWEGADLQGARAQQALMLSLQWQYPEGEETRYWAEERDATGTYRARYALIEGSRETTVVRKIAAYERLHRPEASAGSTGNIRVEGPGLRVTPGDGPWFAFLTSEQSVQLKLGTSEIGRAEMKLVAKVLAPSAEVINVNPSAPQWIWGDLLDLPPEQQAANPEKVPEWVRKLRMDDALQRYNALAGNPNARFRDWVDLMRDWVRAHPEQIPGLLQALKEGRFEARQAEPALFFAMALADLPEARQALLGMLGDTTFSALNRSRAAAALADGDRLPDGYLAEMTRLSKGDGSGTAEEQTAVTSMNPILGMVASRQKSRNPEVAKAAKKALLEQLDPKAEPWRLNSVLSGVGNVRDDSIVEPLTPFLANEDAEIRATAAYALRGVSPEKAQGLYGPTLQQEKEASVRHSLVQAYVDQAVDARSGPTPQVVEASIQALDTETDSKVVRQLVNLLGLASQRGDVSAKSALQLLMQTELGKAQRDLELLQLLGQYL